MKQCDSDEGDLLVLGIKNNFEIRETPLNCLRLKLMSVKDQIPTDQIEKLLLSCSFDPYESCLIAPDEASGSLITKNESFAVFVSEQVA